MKVLGFLISRNTKLFFKDKGTFFSAMIAPLIMLFLFITFLGNVYRSSLLASFPQGVVIDEKIINGFVIGWLISSLLAVCCVTTAFTANMIMVQDKTTGAYHDLSIAPVKQSIIGLGYYFSTFIITLIICCLGAAIGFTYLAFVGWYLSIQDVLLVFIDILLIVLFGTAISSIVCWFLHSQGGITAVTAIVSAVYGFLCGAYMPIAQFSKSIRNFICLLPGTYGTSLLRNHMVSGVLSEMEANKIPAEAIKGIRDGFDINMYFFEKNVQISHMYIVVVAAVVVLIGVYVLLNVTKKKD